MSLGESIRSGTKWLFAGNVGGHVLQFLFGVVLARLLAPADFGILVTIHVFTGVAGLIASGGMGQALVQAKEVEESHFRVVFTLQLAIGMAIYTFFFLMAPWFGRWFSDPLYADLLRVSALSFVLRPFVVIPGARLSRDMRFRAKAAIAFAALTGTGLSSIGMATSGFGVWSLVLGGLVGSTINAVALLIAVRWRPGLRFDTAVAQRYAGYGLLVSATDMIGYFRLQASNFILSRLSGAAAVGLYNKGESLSRKPLEIFSFAAYQTVFRALAKVQDNDSQSQYIYYRTVGLLIVYTMPFYIGLAWLAGPFIEIVYGPKWSESAEPLAILAGGGVFWCLIHPAGAVLAARRWLHREALVQLCWLVLVIAGCLTGLRWGLAGVAWGVLIAHLYSACHMTWLALRCLRGWMPKLLAAAAPGLVLNGILVAVLLALDLLLGPGARRVHPLGYLLLMSTVGALVYAAAFLFLPLESLASEADRWKRTLGLARR